jgi:cytochrome c553
MYLPLFPHSRISSLLAALPLLFILGSRANGETVAAPKTKPSWDAVVPSLEQKCFDCHGGKKTKGGVDLKRLQADPSVALEYELWSKVQEVLKSGEMPPEDAKELSANERNNVSLWVKSALEIAANTNAGDPGPVTLRRLTNAEFDYTIRDLTGVPFQLGKDFVPDGGGGEGFSNIGDALFLSPQQLDKVFTAARQLAAHATIMPGSGIRFTPQRIGIRGPAQFKSDAESAMVVWYQKVSQDALPKDGENLHVAEYITACWKWKHREKTGVTSLSALAKESELNPAFLENWWNFLEQSQTKSRLLDLTCVPWKSLPEPPQNFSGAPPESVINEISKIQEQLNSWFLPAKWSVLRAQQDADELKSYPFEAQAQGEPDSSGERRIHLVVGDLGDGNKGDIILVESPEIFRNGKKESYIDWITGRLNADRTRLKTLTTPQVSGDQTEEVLTRRIHEAEEYLSRLGKHPQGLQVDAKTLVLQAPCVLTLPLPNDAQRFKASGKLDVRNPEIEFASAQWMATTGNPPDPAKIIPGVISVFKRGTETHKRFGSEFGRLHETFSMNLEHRLNQVASNRYRNGKPGPGVYYFSDAQLAAFLSPEEALRLKQMQDDWRFISNRSIPKALEPEWDRKVLEHLEVFATKAWRRPITQEEKAQLASVYTAGIGQSLDRESAAREVLVRTLVAPAFLFKLERTEDSGIHPVNPYELATRLSYFLWSSIPDKELLDKAAAGTLSDPSVLKEQTLRMLKDPKASAMAAQFATQWFEFQNFDATTKVDTAKFTEFTPQLRQDMYEETLAFLSHIIRNNRPVTEILSADYTFLNHRLAAHYQIQGVEGDSLQKVKVSDYGRGGLLGMGAILTKTSYPHRTSPVLRGNWLLRTVLGTPTPPPPNDIPKLDDSVASAKTLRERLERHRADKTCAACHDRIDPLGFALEAFDPIGRLRTKDDAGMPLDDSAQDKEGHKFKGASGLANYLGGHTDEFHSLFCRKLLGYALGRKVLPTDNALLSVMKQQLKSSDPSVAGAVIALVQSNQFLNRRGD